MGQTVALPQEPAGASGSVAVPEVPVEEGGSATAPQEPARVSGSVVAPKVPTEEGGSVAAPLDAREASPSAREQGADSKRPCLDEVEQGPRGSSPKRIHCPAAPI